MAIAKIKSSQNNDKNVNLFVVLKSWWIYCRSEFIPYIFASKSPDNSPKSARFS